MTSKNLEWHVQHCLKFVEASYHSFNIFCSPKDPHDRQRLCFGAACSQASWVALWRSGGYPADGPDEVRTSNWLPCWVVDQSSQFQTKRSTVFLLNEKWWKTPHVKHVPIMFIAVPLVFWSWAVGRHTTSMVHMSADEHQEAVWVLGWEPETTVKGKTKTRYSKNT